MYSNSIEKYNFKNCIYILFMWLSLERDFMDIVNMFHILAWHYIFHTEISEWTYINSVHIISEFSIIVIFVSFVTVL
jgi:hypothetical protein